MWRGGGIAPLSGNRHGECRVLCLRVVFVMRVSCFSSFHILPRLRLVEFALILPRSIKIKLL